MIKELLTESRNELIKKIIESVTLRQHEIAEMVEIYYDAQALRIQHANKKRTAPPSSLGLGMVLWMHLEEKVTYANLAEWIESENSLREAKWDYKQIGIGP